jgi:sulfite exporter TauE/SafE
MARLTGGIRKRFKELFSKKSPVTLFLIGSLNGLLPCGFVYLALVAAASAGNPSLSIGYMAFFGLGTLPMMLFLSLAGNFFGLKFSRWINKATPYVAIAVALLLITRGVQMTEHSCCHR